MFNEFCRTRVVTYRLKSQIETKILTAKFETTNNTTFELFEVTGMLLANIYCRLLS